MKAPKYCELKRRTYFATLKIPKDVQHVFNKTKFSESTKTSDPKIAEERAMLLVGKWKGWIRDARADGLDKITHPFYIEEAIQNIRNTRTEDEYESVVEGYDVYADTLREQGLHNEASVWYKVSRGEVSSLLRDYKDDWVRERLHSLSEKNKKQKQKDIEALFKQFVDVNSLSREAVLEWVRKLLKPISQNGFGKTPDSVFRILATARDYWEYLHDRAVVSEDENLFNTPKFLNNLRQQNKKPDREAFTPEEANNLYLTAISKNDKQLATLILLGMYTGARLEELCNLNTKTSNEDWLEIEKSKSKAGERKIPVHSKLKPIVKSLINDSNDGYLISGLNEDQNGKRSNAIGKRFGRLKSSLGYGKEKVFHSFRRTVTTQLQESGVSIDVIAAIVGHEQPAFTFKHYSDASLDERKIEAIEKLQYPEIEPEKIITKI